MLDVCDSMFCFTLVFGQSVNLTCMILPVKQDLKSVFTDLFHCPEVSQHGLQDVKIHY